MYLENTNYLYSKVGIVPNESTETSRLSREQKEKKIFEHPQIKDYVLALVDTRHHILRALTNDKLRLPQLQNSQMVH